MLPSNDKSDGLAASNKRSTLEKTHLILRMGRRNKIRHRLFDILERRMRGCAEDQDQNVGVLYSCTLGVKVELHSSARLDSLATTTEGHGRALYAPRLLPPSPTDVRIQS